MRNTIKDMGALVCCLLALNVSRAQDFFTETEPVPSDCVDVKTGYGAIGDGVTDDTAAIAAAIAAAQPLNKDVYFPAGKYRISSGLVPKNGVLLRGSTAGISLIQAPPGATVGCGTSDFYAADQNNVGYRDLFFDRVSIGYGTNRSNGMIVSRCVFFSSGSVAPDQWVGFSNPNNPVVEDCVFMKSDKAPGRGIGTYRTSYAKIRRNLFGIDYGHMDWIAASYPGNPNWNLLTEKLVYLREQLGLSWDQGEFMTAMNIGNYDDNAVISDNIMNASPRRLGGSDHAIYAKGFTNLEFYRNWSRGWPRDASGCAKFRNGSGLKIAANTFDDTGILIYVQTDPSDRLYLNDVLIYRNRLIERTAPNAWGTGIGYLRYTGSESDIAIADNVFDCAVGGAHIGCGGYAGFSIYDSNIFAGTTTPVPSSPATIPGAPAAARTAPYATMVLPTPDIPPFSLPPSVSPGSVALSQDVNANDIVYEVLAGGGNSGSSTFTYALTGGNGDGLFGIDPATGEIFATAFIDHTTFAQRTLQVTVTDVNGVSTVGSITLMPFVATVVLVDLGSLQAQGAYTDGGRTYNAVATAGLLNPATGAMGSQNGLLSAANVATSWNVDIAKTNTSGDEAMQAAVWTGAPSAAAAPFTNESTALLSDGIYINNNAAVRVRFTGLNPSFTYDLAAFGALSGLASTPSTFALTTGTSASTATQTLDVDQFPTSGAVARWNAVHPDASGVIAFTVTASGGTSGKRTELNAVRLEVLP